MAAARAILITGVAPEALDYSDPAACGDHSRLGRGAKGNLRICFVAGSFSLLQLARSPMKALLLLIVSGSLGLPTTLMAQEARPDAPALKQVTTEYPKGDKLEARVMTATLAPGSTSPWHTHGSPVAVYVVEGTFTLEFDGRDAISKQAGEALLEPINVKVRAANRSNGPAKVVIFQVSEPEQPFMHVMH
jgi:quercetin dioxygenase-like cupin family protein